MEAGPLDVFISYAPKDAGLYKELEEHLSMLARAGVIRAFSAEQIGAGAPRRETIERHLASAPVVILLVSSTYYAQDDVHDAEMAPALERARAGAVLVIPVIVRDFDWASTPLAAFEVLPKNREPITSAADRDKAWADVARAIREAILSMRGIARRVPATALLTPAYDNAEIRAAAEQLERARARRQALHDAGSSTVDVDREILVLRARLRQGGQLRAGDALGDGRYLLLAQLGRGGFASVWHALDRATDEHVAIKVLHPDLARDPSRCERFFRGARVMAGLQHRTVVKVLEAHGEDEGYLYFVMELIDGPNLHHAVVHGQIQRARALAIVLRAGEALAEAHKRGIVHRDVKPANILIDASGEPHLTDFDLVAVEDTTGGTRTGAAMGSFLFTAPEQMGNAKKADARADVYGLGMTAVFCLHGADLPESTVRRPDRVIEALPCIDAVKRVLSKSIELDPRDRYKDAQELCEALEAATVPEEPSFVVEEQVIVKASSPWESSAYPTMSARNRGERSSLTRMISLAMSATAVILFGVLAFLRQRPPVVAVAGRSSVALAASLARLDGELARVQDEARIEQDAKKKDNGAIQVSELPPAKPSPSHGKPLGSRKGCKKEHSDCKTDQECCSRSCVRDFYADGDVRTCESQWGQ